MYTVHAHLSIKMLIYNEAHEPRCRITFLSRLPRKWQEELEEESREAALQKPSHALAAEIILAISFGATNTCPLDKKAT